MRKVKLVFVESFVEAPTFKDTFSVAVEIDAPREFDKAPIHMIGARTYEADGQSAGLPGGDVNSVILDSHDFSNILGKLLTYVDATFSDLEQRKAHKDIVKNTLWSWEADLRERAVQTVDSHSAPTVYAYPHNEAGSEAR